MIIVAGHARIAPAQRETLAPLIETMVTQTRKEPGCLDYTYAVDLADPAVVRIFERWVDQPALDAHFTKPHVAAFNAGLAQVTIEEISIRIYEISADRDLM